MPGGCRQSCNAEGREKVGGGTGMKRGCAREEVYRHQKGVYQDHEWVFPDPFPKYINKKKGGVLLAREGVPASREGCARIIKGDPDLDPK